jgi:hypothetical protein
MLAAVRICLLAVLTFAVSLGQALASPVPEAVLVASGAVGGLLSLALLLSGVAELAARARNRPRVPATASSRLPFLSGATGGASSVLQVSRPFEETIRRLGPVTFLVTVP